MKKTTLGLGFTALLISSFLYAEQLLLGPKHSSWTLLAHSDVAKNFIFLEPQQQLASSEVAKGLVINNDVVYDPDKLSLDSFQTYEKSFNYNWNDQTTISKNKAKITEIETFFKENPNDWSQLATKDREACGRILYKLGTYYLHVDKDPDTAIAKIVAAQPFLRSTSDQAWAYNQLAYAFERKYQKSQKDADKEKAVRYIAKVTKLYKNAKCKEIAFALNVQDLIKKDALNIAEASLLAALRIYELLGNGRLYALAKNRLASVILEMEDGDDEALTILKDIKKYWQAIGNVEGNPFAAKNLIALGHAYLEVGKTTDEIKGAIRIYQSVYGDNPMPYELYLKLSDMNVDLDEQTLSQATPHTKPDDPTVHKKKVSQLNLRRDRLSEGQQSSQYPFQGINTNFAST